MANRDAGKKYVLRIPPTFLLKRTGSVESPRWNPQLSMITVSSRSRIIEPSVLVTFNASSKKNSSSNLFEAPFMTFT